MVVVWGGWARLADTTKLTPTDQNKKNKKNKKKGFLNKLLTVDLPALMVLPERLEVAIPPSVTSVAEAAVGRDTIMRAVASAVSSLAT